MSNPNNGSICQSSLLHFPDSLYAHSLAGHPTERWHRLDDHLNAVAILAGTMAKAFGSAEWGCVSGLLHDFGKAAPEFQAYLRRENQLDDPEYDSVSTGRINHSSAGAAFAEKFYNREKRPFGRILSYIIAGHHAGLPDYFAADGGNGALEIRLQEGHANLSDLQHYADNVSLILSPLEQIPAFVNPQSLHFWIRMLFSCLTDGDFIDTESFMDPTRNDLRSGNYDLAALKARLDNHMNSLTAQSVASPVNRVRRDVLQMCRGSAQSKPGLYSLTVPTGGGKTLAGMTFALDHALKHGKRRIIYVIPYTSIIEQTAEILKSILGSEAVVEHHSNLDPNRETLRSRLAAENWDAPVIVTTSVQFFESIYAARPSRCRKLHNIADSVVILDEAQMIPPRWLEPSVSAINAFSRDYDVTFLLSTATQPALPKLDTVVEICPSQRGIYSALRRVEYRFPSQTDEPVTWQELSALLTRNDQVLCIVNTRRDCYELFRYMPEGTIHLSALMCGQHRARVIETIKRRLEDGMPIRVVSTQLVEAGVDIDFPAVYRALAGLDSIVQAAGRCNREGKLEGRLGEVTVFLPPRPAPPGLLHKGEGTTREFIALPDFDPHSPDAYTRYFNLFYSKVNDTGAEFLKRLTPSDPTLLDIPFRTAASQFHFIDEHGRVPIIVQYGEGKALIEELRHSGPHRSLLRKLQRFTVNISVWQADKLKQSGMIEEVATGFMAQSYSGLYRDDIGLDVWQDDSVLDDLIGV